MLTNNEIQKIKESSFGSLPASKSFINLIYEDINDIKHKFVDIGFRLNEAQRFNYPEELGYKNIQELAEHLFGFKKSTTYSLINIYQRFGSKMKLLPEYEKFSQSQLTEMCSLPEYLLHHVKPDMTIQDIRDYKKAFNELTVFNEDIIKEPKKLIEDYRNSKTENSGRLEEKNGVTSKDVDDCLKSLDNLMKPLKTSNNNKTSKRLEKLDKLFKDKKFFKKEVFDKVAYYYNDTCYDIKVCGTKRNIDFIITSILGVAYDTINKIIKEN